MKYIGYSILGCIMIYLGIALEFGLLWGFSLLIASPIVIIVLLTVIMSSIIGFCIVKYGWSPEE